MARLCASYPDCFIFLPDNASLETRLCSSCSKSAKRLFQEQGYSLNSQVSDSDLAFVLNHQQGCQIKEIVEHCQSQDVMPCIKMVVQSHCFEKDRCLTGKQIIRVMGIFSQIAADEDGRIGELIGERRISPEDKAFLVAHHDGCCALDLEHHLRLPKGRIMILCRRGKINATQRRDDYLKKRGSTLPTWHIPPNEIIRTCDRVRNWIRCTKAVETVNQEKPDEPLDRNVFRAYVLGGHFGPIGEDIYEELAILKSELPTLREKYCAVRTEHIKNRGKRKDFPKKGELTPLDVFERFSKQIPYKIILTHFHHQDIPCENRRGRYVTTEQGLREFSRKATDGKLHIKPIHRQTCRKYLAKNIPSQKVCHQVIERWQANDARS